jgi:hypothetical protein
MFVFLRQNKVSILNLNECGLRLGNVYMNKMSKKYVYEDDDIPVVKTSRKKVIAGNFSQSFYTFLHTTIYVHDIIEIYETGVESK